jgi:hypothetical protein
LVKILKLFDRDPGSRMEKIQIGDQGSRMEKFRSRIWNPGGKKIQILDPGSGINIPEQQNLKSCLQIC